MSLVVKFNSVEEFLEELKKSPPSDNIVRHTTSYLNSTISPNINHVSVLASYLNKQGQIVRLVYYCGDVWGIGTEDDKTYAVVNVHHARIEAACKDHGLEDRSGSLQEEDKDGN